MNLHKPIGGYFELELGKGNFPYKDAVLLNSARHSFEYILRANKVNKVYVPKFMCDVMLEPLKKLNIDHTLYSIDKNLEIDDAIDLDQDEFILYVNYFGIKDKYSRSLVSAYNNQLILDCSQAFYFEAPEICHTIYSPRKFFGVPDGGVLYTQTPITQNFQTDKSYKRFAHLIKRIDLGAEAGYDDFKADDASLSHQPIMSMSNLTRRLLDSIGYEGIKEKRHKNFEFIHSQLSKKNELKINTDDLACPMVYPFQTTDSKLRERLINNKVFVAKYWPNVLDWSEEHELEHKFTEEILPLPIDQRYGKLEMERILQIINES